MVGDDLTIYMVAESARLILGKKIPGSYDQLGSFDREHFAKRLDGIFGPHIASTVVNSTRLPDFVRHEQQGRINTLHIDAGDHDLKVFESLNFEDLVQEVILINHKHLSVSDRSALRGLFEARRFQTSSFKSDPLAVQPFPL
jgi:hypothetical protein